MGLLLIIAIFLIAIIAILGLLHFRDSNHFESRGIHYIGNTMYGLITSPITGKSFLDQIVSQYSHMKSKNVKIAGVHDFGVKTYIITDLDLVKNILVKDFDHFVDRRELKVPDSDVIFSKMLIAVKGDRWKSLRSKMSPTFTTGKIRRMFQIFDKSGKNLVQFVEQEMKKSGEIDLAEGYSKYTMDVIASAAFGIDSKAFEQSEPSVFEKMGRKFQIQFGGLQIIKFLLLFMAPKIADLLKLTFFQSAAQDFFSNVIKTTVKHREDTGEKRNDFIQLMLEARHGQLKTEEGELDDFEMEAIVKVNEEAGSNKITLDDDTIAANCIVFIIGGFDTTQSLLLFAGYALALNQDVQDKLREEINDSMEKNDGKFTYDSVNKMEYMDAFINETLRYYPPPVATDRGCTQEYKVPGTNITIKKGEGVSVPIYGIHHDKKYYEEPSKFNPERFLPENRSKLNPYAFLPFGHGPRNCIGMRFALIEVKVALSHLVHSFTIEPSKKTLIPMKYSNSSPLKPEGGMWLALNRRN